MVLYKNHWAASQPFLAADNPRFRVFFEPNTGANAPAGGAAPAGNGAQAEGNVTSQNAYDTIPWDELPPAVRTTMEAIRADHERVANLNGQLTTEVTRLRTSTANPPQPQPQAQPTPTPAGNPIDDAVVKAMKAKGYTEQQIRDNAGLFGALFSEVIPLIKADIGREFMPVAHAVVNHDNDNQFEQAHNSEEGQFFMSDPAVAQAVYDIVAEQSKQGKSFSSAAVINIARMEYADRQRTGGPQSQQTNNPTPTGSSFFPTVRTTTQTAMPTRSTGFNFPGAQFVRPTYSNGGQQQQRTDGTRTTLNEDTRAGLATTFAEMGASSGGIVPKAFKEAGDGRIHIQSR